MFQRDLIQLANAFGYDGMEPVWLIYQDCAASDHDERTKALQTRNAISLKKGLHFVRKEPLPQLPQRVSYWNSTIERGVRGDALRAILQQFASVNPVVAQS